MQKIASLFKSNLKMVIGIFVGLVIGGITAYAAGTVLFQSNIVGYVNTESGLTSTNVKGALDELYTKYTQLECQGGYAKYDETTHQYICNRPICKAVTDSSKLHSEQCNNANTTRYCQGDGYEIGEDITYGSIWDGESALVAGNAFDCDVDGDGEYTERFYYVSDYFNTQTQTFDSTTAVLTYSYPMTAFANILSGAHIDGPIEATEVLPLTSGSNAWTDELLKVTDTVNNTKYRTILACASFPCVELSTTASGDALPTAFEYKNSNNIPNAARLLTTKEIENGCYNGSNAVGSLSVRCKFLFELTSYADNVGDATNGYYWYLMLETPQTSNSEQEWFIGTVLRNLGYNMVPFGGKFTVRPTIDVDKTKIEYEA